MVEIFGMELENEIPTLVIYIILLFMIWVLPKSMGLKEWGIGLGIMMSIVFLPITYFIVNAIARKG